MNVLVLCDRPPWPARSGGQIRLAQMVEALSELGKVTICVVQSDQADEIPEPDAAHHRIERVSLPRTARSAVVSRIVDRSPWWNPWGGFDFEAARRDIGALGVGSVDVAWAYTPVVAPLLAGWGATLRVLDFPDLPGTNLGRKLEQIGRTGVRSSYARWRVSRAYDRAQNRACTYASLVTVSSDIDRQHLRCDAPVVVVQSGYPPPAHPVGRLDVGGDPTLVFQGTLGAYGNREAAVFFAREVFPLVRARIPNAQFRLVGNADEELRHLVEADGVTVTGFVEHIEDELAKATAIVVPLRIGSGTRLKIIEAWAHGIPVVSTTLGAEGLPVTNGSGALIADSPPDLADACVSVLTDRDLRGTLVDSGRQIFAANFETVGQTQLLDACRAHLQGANG